jgi:hypothetical protein
MEKFDPILSFIDEVDSKFEDDIKATNCPILETIISDTSDQNLEFTK